MAYRASSLRGLAIAQMVFGALMMVFGVGSIIAVDYWSSYVAFGIWVGIWVLITGILGYIGAKNDLAPNKCLIGCFMGFSITACVLAGIMFIFYCIAVAELVGSYVAEMITFITNIQIIQHVIQIIQHVIQITITITVTREAKDI
ncbi:hypothetical protein OS493_019542 [Desmophyllum pertusum]|uniref:Uncharacterized protein n=1 Tax=Desmophyllum pertusum TaxID=174260 RepID=A0A9W9ZRV5_9CNID|nr:hypothetical protein OS493_019542 [Desmophyllum pertusum]